MVLFCLLVDVMLLSLCCDCVACLLPCFVCFVLVVVPLDCKQKVEAENQYSTSTSGQREGQCCCWSSVWLWGFTRGDSCLLDTVLLFPSSCSILLLPCHFYSPKIYIVEQNHLAMKQDKTPWFLSFRVQFMNILPLWLFYLLSCLSNTLIIKFMAMFTLTWGSWIQPMSWCSFALRSVFILVPH